MGYGRVEARIQMPPGPGTLPAFWLLGSDYPEVGHPESGEIDIIEYVQSAFHPPCTGRSRGKPTPATPARTGVSRSRVPAFDPSAELPHLLGGAVARHDHHRRR